MEVVLSKTNRERSICDLGLITKHRASRRRDRALDLWRRQAPTASP
jgi:hypothetical protein